MAFPPDGLVWAGRGKTTIDLAYPGAISPLWCQWRRVVLATPRFRSLLLRTRGAAALPYLCPGWRNTPRRCWPNSCPLPPPRPLYLFPGWPTGPLGPGVSQHSCRWTLGRHSRRSEFRPRERIGSGQVDWSYQGTLYFVQGGCVHVFPWRICFPIYF